MTTPIDDQDLIDHMLSELERPAKVLTDLEQSFLASVVDQWHRRRSLTKPQREKLETIYTERTA